MSSPPEDLAGLRALAQGRPTARLGVVAAEDAVALEAAAAALDAGIAQPTLYGDPVRLAAKAPAGLLDRCTVVPAASGEEAAALAARDAGTGAVEILLKGALRTDELLRAVLAPGAGLRTGRVLSDVLVCEDHLHGHPRLIGVTDGGVAIAPTLAAKREIVLNAVEVFHRLGFTRPRIAVMSATEVVTQSMPSTLDAQALTQEAARGELGECEVFGPLALDNALLPSAAQAKGIESPVAGHADCLVAPSIEAGNLLGKAFRFLRGGACGHVIVGAKVPVLIPSRVESTEDKLTSIALGVIACG
ncbi:MAG: phosphate acyltransferase [Solirubrobacteraceae bacterium]